MDTSFYYEALFHNVIRQQNMTKHRDTGGESHIAAKIG